MRVFIGIKLDDNTLGAIEKFLEPFKKISTPIRWVKLKNVHLTLKFIGEVSEEICSEIENILINNNYNIEPFEITVEGCGKFGRGSSLSILWTGIGQNEKLSLLFKKIEDSLEKIGINKETRDFKPHLTVGRNRKQFNFKSILKLIEENVDVFISKFRVNAFQFIKSELTQTGPIYTVLKEISLGTA